MTFKKDVAFTFNKTAANGVSLGTESQIIETNFKVRTVYVTAHGATADLYSSFDGESWQLFNTYEFMPDYTSGVNVLEQAESQIKLLPDFA